MCVCVMLKNNCVTVEGISCGHYNLTQCGSCNQQLQKYFDLSHEFTDMWNVTCSKIIPIVFPQSCLFQLASMNLRRLDFSFVSLPAQMPKSVLLRTAYILRRFLYLSPWQWPMPLSRNTDLSILNFSFDHHHREDWNTHLKYLTLLVTKL